MQSFSGTREVQLLREDNEAAKMAQFQVLPSKFSMLATNCKMPPSQLLSARKNSASSSRAISRYSFFSPRLTSPFM